MFILKKCNAALCNIIQLHKFRLIDLMKILNLNTFHYSFYKDGLKAFKSKMKNKRVIRLFKNGKSIIKN